jgi:predicted nucleic acid-binding protein
VKISERLQSVRRLFLDTAPVVYYVEESAQYLSRVDVVFERVDNGGMIAVTSPVTLAECLVIPIRKSQAELQQAFIDLIVAGNHVDFSVIDQPIAQRAAELRAHYNLRLPDSLQLAVALNTGCDAFLTNDRDLKRVTEIDVLVLDDLEPD